MTFRIDEEDNLRYEGRDGIDHMVYKHPLLTKLIDKKIVNAFLNQHDEAVIILEDGTEISTDCDDVLSIDGEWYWHWMTVKHPIRVTQIYTKEELLHKELIERSEDFGTTIQNLVKMCIEDATTEELKMLLEGRLESLADQCYEMIDQVYDVFGA